MSDVDFERLRLHLDAMLEVFNQVNHLTQDPVELVWSMDTRQDRELCALVSSSLAYGRVQLVRDAARRIMDPLGTRPTETLCSLSNQDLNELYSDFVYRMTKGKDIVDLLVSCRQLFQEYETLEAVYALGRGNPVERASAFVHHIRAHALRPELSRGFRYLLPDPADGGTSKRLHLFLRWMGRGPDEIDPKVWNALDARDLRMPLDTHTSRLCRYLGLCSRKSLDAKTVEEVTSNLRRLDPQDPLKYDFPICHLGISGSCIHKKSDAHCPQCPLEPVCTLDG